MPPYLIRVTGRVDDEDASALGLVVVRHAEETVLRGEVVDQAQLLGLIDHVQSLGLELVEARRDVDAGAEAP